QVWWRIIAGTGEGLYGINRYGAVSPLWTGGGVSKIVRTRDFWAVLSDQGVWVSPDLIQWESRNNGLPEKTIKVYDEGKKSFITVIQELKDLEVNPANPDIMVCATKEAVFLTRDQGRSWKSLGFPSYRTNGVKAVAAANLPDLTIFISHSIYGVHYLKADAPGAGWTELIDGLEKLETTGNPDEVSDIVAAVIQSDGENSPPRVELYAAQTFRRRIYRLDWERKRFIRVWSDASDFGAVDSLDIDPDALRFVQEGTVMEIRRNAALRAGEADGNSQMIRSRPDLIEAAQTLTRRGIPVHCMVVPENSLYPGSELVTLSELWLLDVFPRNEGLHWEDNADSRPSARFAGDERRTRAANREGLYLPVNHAMDSQSLKPYLDIIENRKLNMVVIDMKDDYGRLRFSPVNPAIAEKGRVFRPVDLDVFLETMKERGIYTAARVVVFKDPELARKEGGKFAVWNGRTNRPWKGYYDSRRLKTPEGRKPSNLQEIFPAGDPAYEIVRTYYDEEWVDPYAEEVWDYIAAVGQELHERGFDEIQFDYIRFPTDGDNLADARYRWRENGMDMESAMLSFLRHIRARISAPLSIDIYGANGWYRTGARTGQEVELLAPYVDVICPMYYPSHFEQNFLAQRPAELRPYRIYYQGTQRTARIARGQIVVRPYVQAFYLNVSYDRTYYNADYVFREVEGVRDAGDGGLTYWNNSGRYDDIPAPIQDAGDGGPKAVHPETSASLPPGDS
ncbi:MAG: hypothetical protein LBH70_04445, partial [Spirochaetaceae bacterium]|nr:hypothetical protein [Spirochaetaceae bacterium]